MGASRLASTRRTHDAPARAGKGDQMSKTEISVLVEAKVQKPMAKLSLPSAPFFF
jgi:hypothetical protein